MYFCLFYFLDENIVWGPQYILYADSIKYVYQHNTVQVCTAQSDVFYSQFDTEVAEKLYIAQKLTHSIITRVTLFFHSFFIFYFIYLLFLPHIPGNSLLMEVPQYWNNKKTTVIVVADVQCFMAELS